MDLGDGCPIVFSGAECLLQLVLQVAAVGVLGGGFARVDAFGEDDVVPGGTFGALFIPMTLFSSCFCG